MNPAAVPPALRKTRTPQTWRKGSASASPVCSDQAMKAFRRNGMGPRSWIGMLSSVVPRASGFAKWRVPSEGPALRSPANLLLLFCAALGLALPGCEKGKTLAPPKEIPDAVVSQPVERDVTDFADFTGRTEAVNSVNIVPRVTV